MLRMKVVKDQASIISDTKSPFEYNLWTGKSFASASESWLQYWITSMQSLFDAQAEKMRKNEKLISLLVDLYVEAYKVLISKTFYVPWLYI